MSTNNIFEILRETETKNIQILEKTAGIHLNEVLEPILKKTSGLAGEDFLNKFISAYKKTGSPLVINLDHNISGNSLDQSEKKCEEMRMIVKATAGHVSGYKMNFQSLLTFLIAKRPNFVQEIKKIYSDTCVNNFGVKIEPTVWLDQKLDDIPNTNFESGDILYKLGFDAVHCMPVIGPDSAGGLQLAAESNNNAGVIHVINLTHQGYKYSKKEYFKGENGEDTILKLRENAMGNLTFPTEVSGMIEDVTLRAIGTIEPANRPFELYQGYTKLYKKNLMIISIGIGPQGALPGCALYSGATCEGIGRFIYKSENKLDTMENITKKAQLSKLCTLFALSSRFSGEKYPIENIITILKDFNPKISEETQKGLKEVYEAIKSKGLY